MSRAAPPSPGYYEEYHLVHHSLGLDNGVIIAAQYKHSSQTLGLETLRSAVSRVAAREPAMRLGIADLDTAKAQFVICKVDAEVLADVVTASSASWDDSASFTQLLNEEASKPGWPEPGRTGPLWRVVLCRDNSVVFSYHHAIGDGKSGIAFHTMVLQALNSQDTSSTPREVTTPPIEQCIDVSPSWSMIFKEILEMLLPASWKAAHVVWVGNDVPQLTLPLDPSERVKPLVRLFEYSSADVSRLLTLSKQHGSTFTSTLYTIMVTAYSRSILETQQPPPHITSLFTVVAMSLRHLSHVSDDEFCNHVTGWLACAKLSPTFEWERAQEIAASLKHMRNGEAARVMGMLGYIRGKMHSIFGSQMGKKRTRSFTISNLGVLPTSCTTGDGWTIGKTAFCSTGVLSGPTCNIDVIGHGDGGISIVITRDPRSLDEEFAQRLFAEFEKETRGIIEQPS